MIGREEVGRKRRKRGREVEMERRERYGREISGGVLGSFEYCCSMYEGYCFC